MCIKCMFRIFGLNSLKPLIGRITLSKCIFMHFQYIFARGKEVFPSYLPGAKLIVGNFY